MRKAFITLLLSGCIGLGAGGATSSEPPPTLVRVATAQAGALDDVWALSADVRAMDRAQLAAGAEGPVVELASREGARVSRGDVLLRVDSGPASARYALAQAEARETQVALERAERELQRIEQVREGVLSASELDEARTAVASLRARHARQQAAAREAAVLLGRHQVTAPFDGDVANVMVSEGDWVSPGQQVIELVSSNRLDLRVDAPRALVGQVALGDAVGLTLGEQRAQARVVGVVPSLDRASRTAVVRLEPVEPVPGWLVAGLSVTAVFDVHRQAQDAARIPRDALVLGAAGTRVVKVVEGQAESVEVTVVATAGESALVRPLQPGDVVVTRGNERLRTGQAVVLEERQ